MVDGLQIREWAAGDNVSELTELLHRAYKPLLDMGLRFVATWQDDSITLDRITKGKCFLATLDGRVVATVTLYDPQYTSGCPWYDRDDVAHFGQFAVEPTLQGRGIGNAMMDYVETLATKHSTAELALDTSELAHHLIDYYSRRGYRFIEHTQWPEVNYRSVIMSKTL
jgi:GNAT superfamily N-acetyltransferase